MFYRSVSIKIPKMLEVILLEWSIILICFRSNKDKFNIVAILVKRAIIIALKPIRLHSKLWFEDILLLEFPVFFLLSNHIL